MDYFSLPLILSMPAAVQTSSFSPPGAPPTAQVQGAGP
jgi:hypothetical protein